MGWGIDYTYKGYLNRITEDSVDSVREDCKRRIELYWREILAYMAATPPAYDTDEEGYKMPMPETLAVKVAALRESLEEDMYTLMQIDQYYESIEQQKEIENEQTC